MKGALRRVLERLAPRWSAAFFAARARRHNHRVVRGWGCHELNAKLIARLGDAVREGPFAGTMLGPMARTEHLGPFLLGVYESELDAAWATVLRGSYSQILDIGSSFGYYAAGLARRFPAARVIAFDVDPWARRATREAARANRLANLEVRGACDAAWLARHLLPGALIISDCEGYEGELFTGREIPALRSATAIIETHDVLVPGVAERVAAVFRGTHGVTVIATGGARRASTADLGFLTPEERAFAGREVRGPQQWLQCVPAAAPRAA